MKNIVKELKVNIKDINYGKQAGVLKIFPKIKQLPISCEKLADYLLFEAGVTLLPRTADGKFGDGYLRLSYANSIENIRESIRRMKIAIEKFS